MKLWALYAKRLTNWYTRHSTVQGIIVRLVGHGASEEMGMATTNTSLVPDEILTLVKQANAGDRSAADALGRALDKHPDIVTHVGDRTRHVRDTLVALVAGPDNLAEQIAVKKHVAALEAEVAGPTPNVLERLLAQRVALAWLHHTLLENSIALTMEQSVANPKMEGAERSIDCHQKWLNHSHKRFLSAVKALAQVRKLQVPDVQVNIGQNQINVAR